MEVMWMSWLIQAYTTLIRWLCTRHNSFGQPKTSQLACFTAKWIHVIIRLNDNWNNTVCTIRKLMPFPKSNLHLEHRKFRSTNTALTVNIAVHIFVCFILHKTMCADVRMGFCLLMGMRAKRISTPAKDLVASTMSQQAAINSIEYMQLFCLWPLLVCLLSLPYGLTASLSLKYSLLVQLNVENMTNCFFSFLILKLNTCKVQKRSVA